jgi:hypothetical protein
MIINIDHIRKIYMTKDNNEGRIFVYADVNNRDVLLESFSYNDAGESSALDYLKKIVEEK